MLEARGLRYAYPGASSPVIDGFDLSIAPGERVAISAPSGTGKTTLCRILAGYLPPDAGEVRIDGDLLPKTGICPVQLIGQHPELAVDPKIRLASTLLEAGCHSERQVSAGNYPRYRRRKGSYSNTSEVDQGLLEALGIQSQWLNRYPHELSGGELQRFCIARAVCVHPKYLVADEITTMLDAVTQARIWEFLLSWQQETNAGLIVVTHSEALRNRLAERVVFL